MVKYQQKPINKASSAQRSLIYGVGINDADYIVRDGKDTCPIYSKWSSMIKRCYSDKALAKFPKYKGCTVCDEWLVFSNFKLWMESKEWKGLSLDKDILVQGNKIYSPSTCVFVPLHVNNLLLDRRSLRGKYMQGVDLHSSGRFRASCRRNSKNTHIGLYDTELLAHEAYKRFKYKVIKEVAESQPKDIRDALLSFVIT